MEPEQYARVKVIFAHARELEGEERTRYLTDQCGEDTNLRVEVEKLLRSDESAAGSPVGRALQEPAAGLGSVPKQIGPYRILEQIGTGGMGEVYLAEQEEPIRRRVALKLIRAGFETETVIQRFNSERQALAMMDHENIARAYDAGTTEDGRPYFVMEYVEGIPLTEYCNAKRLDTAERLELLAQVCDGLQHAHQKAIIHRDIKPSNVLVREQDGRAIPKIIDFGVAKAAAPTLTERTLFTEFGQLVGTPEYMSPEQADTGGDDVDTRTDIYAVGVLMYEMLIGVLPFDPVELRKAGYEEILRRIREDDPPRPSTRLSSLGELSQATFQQRRTTGHRLSVQIRGELDWITMKALEKDRSRRYGSASNMAEDLRRYLRHEPISAGPPGPAYRVSKFVRRNRIPVAFSALALLFLVALAISNYVQANRIAAERDRANAEAESAHGLSEFLVGLFREADPGRTKGADVTAREILRAGAERIQSLDDQPEAQATFRETIGSVYGVMGLFDEGIELLEQAYEYRKQSAKEDPDSQLALAETQYTLGQVYLRGGDPDSALPLARESVETIDRLLGPSSELGNALNALGNALQNTSEFEEAEAVHRRSLQVRREVLGPDHPDLSASLHNVGSLRLMNEDYAEAERYYRESIQIAEKAEGPMDYGVATTLHTLALVYAWQDRFEEALPFEERSLAIREKVLGGLHPHVALSLTTMASIHEGLGDPAKGEPLARRAVEIGMECWGADDQEVWWMQRSHASVLNSLGRHEEALEIMEPLVARVQAAPRRTELGLHLAELARTYASLDRIPEAESAYRESLQVYIDTEQLASTDHAKSVKALAELYRKLGREAEALELESELEEE